MLRKRHVAAELEARRPAAAAAAARIVRHQHERFDGGSYPDGLAGDDIPIGSRIILACDACHAMASDRPYRQAMPTRRRSRRSASTSARSSTRA